MKKIVLMSFAVLAVAACTHKVQVEAPEKPIEINLNVNIEHKVKVEIDRDVQDAIAQNNEIF